MPIRDICIFDDLGRFNSSNANPYYLELVRGTRSQSIPSLYGPYLIDKAGSWARSFQCFEKDGSERRPLILEVGCHHGETLCQLASDHPKMGFIGMDITFKRVVTTAKKLQRCGQTNAWAILGNAEQAENIFSPGELDGVVVFFPDPWKKKRSQLNRQLFSQKFCFTLSNLIRENGFLWIKTDDSSYFFKIRGFLERAAFRIVPDYPFSLDYSTCFQRNFARNQIGYEQGVWRKVCSIAEGYVGRSEHAANGALETR